VVLALPPKIAPNAGSVQLRKSVFDKIARNSISLLCEYDDSAVEQRAVRRQLEIAAIAIQLVKPTYSFLDLWIQLDSTNLSEMVTRPVQDIDRFQPEPYLKYQQHNCITYEDIQRAMGLIPALSKVLDPAHDSWTHPLLPIHRAVMFFCQGYSVTPSEPSQFLWAAGLDCLYASKLVKKAQSSLEIARRMHILLEPKLKLYEADTVTIPFNQTSRTHSELEKVSGDIFRLRNAFAHGKLIPDISWLSDKEKPLESGYAYQLMEQTEIALRLTLLRIFEDTTIFDIFSDSVKLDSYFPVQ
jgi:hypothetical protein